MKQTPEFGLFDPKVVPTIEMDIPAHLANSLSISALPEDDLYLPKEVPGYLGAGYEFELGGEFKEAKLSFKFSPEFKKEGFEPAIYYYDEAKQILSLVDDQAIDWENNTVTTIVEHFSKYILLNSTEFEKVWESEIKPPSYTGQVEKPLDIVLVIDSSGSMSWNDPQDIRKKAAKEFVNKLGKNDQGAIVDFDSWAILLSGLTSDKNKLNSAIDRIDSSGGTAIYSGFQMGLDLFANRKQEGKISTFSTVVGNEVVSKILDKKELEDLEEEGKVETMAYGIEEISMSVEDRDSHRFMIIMTDGEDNYKYNYAPLIESAKNKDVTVYTIGLGSELDERLLRDIAEPTGGKYYHATSYEDLEGVFDDAAGETIDYLTDSNGDGISDYYSKLIYEGKLRTGNGVSFKGIDFNSKKDYDNDGLKNGDEIKVVVEGDMVYLKMLSDPTKKDTDGDGIGDKIDPEPLVYNITDRTLALASSLSYSNLKNKEGKLVADNGKEELSKFTVIKANDSGYFKLNDFFDGGLGSVAIKIKRPSRKDAVILAFRGTEMKDDIISDGITDLGLGFGLNTKQSRAAFNEYRKIAGDNPNVDMFLAGHSLGGRLVQDTLFNIFDKNDGFFGINKKNILIPVNSATFNALGYNKIQYYENLLLKKENVSEIKKILNNYYYKHDLVGEGLGNSLIFKRLGTDIGPWTAKIGDQAIVPDGEFGYVISKLHGINLFFDESNLIYPNIKNYY